MGMTRLALLFAIGAVCSAQQPPTATAATRLVRARICDAEGKPLANAGAVFGAPTEVSTTDALEKPMARSGSDGRIEFAIPVVEDQFEQRLLLIAAPGKVAFLCPNPHRRLPWVDPTRAPLDFGDLRLPNAHVLTGRVRDADGAPVVGARLHACDALTVHPTMCPGFGSQVFTDEKGVFRLVGVFPGAMTVSVHAEGFFTRPMAGVGVGTPLDVVLEKSGFVEGTVTTVDGKPANGSVVLVNELVDAHVHRAPVVEGRFRIGRPGQGRFRVSAFGPSGEFLTDSEVLDGPSDGLALRVADDTSNFAVRAVDAATGAAVRGFQASVLWGGVGRSVQVEAQLVQALRPIGTGGVVHVDPPRDVEGAGIVFVRAPGYAPFFAENVAYVEKGTFAAKLVAGVRVSGKVLEPVTGRPVAGAMVRCTAKGLSAAEVGFWGRSSDPVVTGPDGAFAFENLEATDHVIEVRHAMGSVVAKREVAVNGGPMPESVVIELSTGVTVRGRLGGAQLPPGCRVVLASGDPLGAASLPWAVRGGLTGQEIPGAVPVVDGAFELPHRAPGRENLYLVVPQPPRQGAPVTVLLQAIEVKESDVVVEVDLAGRLPGVLRGKVTAVGAEVPPSRLVVTAEPESAVLADAFSVASMASRWALVQPDGSFVLPLPRGRHRVAVVDSVTGIRLLANEFVTVESAATLAKDLRVEVTEVRVRLAHATGAPLSVSRLSVLAPGQSWGGYQPLFGGGVLGLPGVDVSSASAELAFFVPPGVHDLRLRGAADSLARGQANYDDMMAGETTTITVEAGKVHEVTLQMPLPKELGGK